MEPLYTMSTTELARLRTFEAVQTGQVTLAEAARRLNLSVRQIKRLKRAYARDGAAGLISKHRGRPSNNRTDPELLAAAIERVREHYHDFGPTFASEKLAADGLPIKRERLRLAMIEAGLWKQSRRRRRVIHPSRERRPQFGELVQGDGSPHAWFEDRGTRCSLLLFIDDATSQIGAAHFAPSETTEAYFALTKQYITKHGKPCALYVDKHGIFRSAQPTDHDDLTQFARAMHELNIELICANSPQAKGRVERANRTLQDRLVKELRLRNINNLVAANAYLPEFLRSHNARFAVSAQCTLDAHQPLLAHEDLQRILVHTEERIVSKNLTIKFKGQSYQLAAPGLERRLQHQHVWVRDLGETILIEHRGAHIEFEQLHFEQRPVVDAKTLNEKLDRSRLGTRIPNPKKQHTPAPNHAWRTYATRLPSSP
jgi:transposase